MKIKKIYYKGLWVDFVVYGVEEFNKLMDNYKIPKGSIIAWVEIDE